MTHRTSSYAEGVFDAYWFEINLHGDIVAVYDNSGTKLVSYIYDDAWGRHLTAYSKSEAEKMKKH